MRVLGLDKLVNLEGQGDSWLLQSDGSFTDFNGVSQIGYLASSASKRQAECKIERMTMVDSTME